MARIPVASRVDTAYIPTQHIASGTAGQPAILTTYLGPNGHLVGIPEVGKQSLEVSGWPSSATGRLGPAITSTSRKIISICLGQQSWPAGASTYRNRRLQPSPVRAQAHLDLTQVRMSSICPPTLEEGCHSLQAGDSACAARGGGFLCEVGGSLRTLGNPGRFLEMPVLAAAQGVCGNDTARAAEIPPLLTLAGKWSSSSGTINGDRSLRGAGGQRARGGGGEEGQHGQ